MALMVLIVILTAALLLFFALHVYILIKTWNKLKPKIRSAYLVVLLIALSYADLMAMYVHTSQDIYLKTLIHGLLATGLVAVLFPNELIELQKNEIKYGPFISDKKRQNKLLKNHLLNVQIIRWFGTVLVVFWASVTCVFLVW